MTVSIHLSAETEEQLRRWAAATGQDVDRFVEEVVKERLAEEAPPRPRRSKETFRQRLKEWIALHPPSHHFVDDSRESIYAGRGE